jgi:hypothetical protein
MQYLNPGPMTFGPPLRRRAEKTVVLRGGPAAVIPKQHRCASGHHNKRLTQCFCAQLQMKTKKK